MDPFLSALELGALIASKKVTCVEATRSALDRIAASKSHAFESLAGDALQEAEKRDAELAAGKPRGPLHGVPIGIKDLCDVAGCVTAAGMAIKRSTPPADKDSTVAARLRAAGCVILGKLQNTESAYAEHHPEFKAPVNPWHEELWPGVSSSGSGVAVASGLAYASLGSDTLGSIRFPCAMNGLVGIKPTWGRVPRSGVWPLAESLDHIGPMCRTVEDCAAVLQVIAGETEEDLTAARVGVPDYLAEMEKGAKGIKVGIDRGLIAATCDELVKSIVDKTVSTLESLGIEIVDIKLPDFGQAAGDAFTLCATECAAAHKDHFPSRKTEYGASLADLIETGLSIPSTSLADAWIRRPQFRGAFSRVFDGCDVVLLPAMPLGPLTLSDISAMVSDPAKRGLLTLFTGPIDYAALPALVMPGGFSNDGYPVGIQFIAPEFGEAQAIRVGKAVQDGHGRVAMPGSK